VTTCFILEPDVDMRCGLLGHLADETGLTVVAAPTVEELRALYPTRPPALVVLGLPLPHVPDVAALVSEIQKSTSAAIIVATSDFSLVGDLVIGRNVYIESKPLSADRLNLLARRHIRPSRTIVTRFGILDIVQMLCVGGHSSLLVCTRAGKDIGSIIVRDGAVWTARDELGEGSDALWRLLSRDTVARPYPAPPGKEPRTIEGSWQNLLIEAARRADEAAGKTPFETLLEQAGRALLAREYAEAARLFSEASAMRPEDEFVRLNLERLRKLGFGPKETS
jgi:hypothetical protein